MIREIHRDEFPKLEVAAREFYAAARLPGEINFEVFCKNWEFFYDNKMGTIFALLTEDGSVIYGAIGCIKVPDLLTGKMIASEMFWFVREEFRGDGFLLMKAFEKWAKEQGCLYVRMMYLPQLMADSIRNIYKRMGYREIEVAFEKEVM